MIPADAVKMTPETDMYPPILYSDEFEVPIPMPGPINTRGAEDSPFMMPDGNTFYVFFTPDVRVPAERQLLDNVTGIYFSHKVGGQWTEPELIVSQFAGEPKLDNEGNLYFTHHFYENGTMLEADIYVAYRK